MVQTVHTAVIGAGPAGAACALWLHQFGCDVLLLEKSQRAGGLQNLSPYINRWLPSVRGLQGQEIAGHLHAQLLECGVPLRLQAEVRSVARHGSGLGLDFSDGSHLLASSLVLATGTRFCTGGFSASARLSIGPGKAYESFELRGKRVAVLGGADNAFDAHRFAMQRGAAHAQIFARSVRAQSALRRLVPQAHVTVGACTVDQQAMTVNGEPFDFISVQYGFEPVVPRGLEELGRTPSGYIQADHWGLTSVDNVYAVGDVTNTFHPATATSFAHGIQAAKHIHTRLEAQGLSTVCLGPA